MGTEEYTSLWNIKYYISHQIFLPSSPTESFEYHLSYTCLLKLLFISKIVVTLYYIQY